MDAPRLLRSRIKAARKRRAYWVRILDLARLLPTSEGRANLWTRTVHKAEVHQTSATTSEDRYPALFDLACRLAPQAKRLLSFGCSTGEELLTLRRRFPNAEIVGAEINPRSRSIATRRVASDRRTSVIRPEHISGEFDLVFVLAVLQREPHKVEEMDVKDLSPVYPFERFDQAVSSFVQRLRAGGLLCVMNAHYPVESSTVATKLSPIEDSPLMEEPLFGPDGLRLKEAIAHTIFRKA
jgi:hypothetical protein